jgi:formylglycine-generating enzyme required for sulfatase activity
VKIVPKGLRSFDATDADFFLELLPGPRDRDGLPDSIRFWKSRIETTDADSTFSVGLIYGPSGCGKSSLVKAGQLPRLAKSVTAVYVEATGEETEARLLKGLRRQLPDLPNNLGLIESLAGLRRGRFLESGQKVLLVLDQFEQWLHAKRSEENTELVQALRHCDGGRLQGIVMVRDDFGMAANRFMRALEVRLVEGDNFATVDLFDLLHARKVLAAFGRAYGHLPDNLSQCSKEQDAFLDQAVAELTQDGKVISVRLALFAEMLKGKPWTATTLTAVGGTEGVGVTFLEETFATATAPPQHRLHQQAAQAVLKALLPESDTDLKGHMRSQQELLEASGYDNRPKDFDELIRILDSELRLITPTDPERKSDADPSTVPADAKYYQLTHDYLVPSLRDWLTRKQKETRRGRAELLLADRTSVWNARPEKRQLPSLWQWLQLRCLTRRESWTPPQRKMMRKASRLHGVRALVMAAVLVLLGWGLMEAWSVANANLLVEAVSSADTAKLPQLLTAIEGVEHGRSLPARWLLLSRLRRMVAESEPGSPQRLRASLCLLPVDPSQAGFLCERLLDAGADELPVIRDTLAPYQDDLVEKLWAAAEQPARGREQQRLRAGYALASYDPDSQRWDNVGKPVANDLVNVPAVYLGTWMESLHPVRQKLLAPLAAIFRDTKRRETERSLATEILADYATDQPQLLADLLLDADEKQFAVLFPKLQARAEAALAPLHAEFDLKAQPSPWPDEPLRSEWKNPDEGTRQRLEAAQGMLEERFAFSQTLPLADFTALAETLRPCGYRPIRVRPYTEDGAVRVAAVWHRDGREWQLVQGQTAAEIQNQDRELQKKGDRPVDVAGWQDKDQARFVAVWAKEQPTDDVRLYVGIAEKSHAAAWRPFRADKLQPVTLQAFFGSDGQARYSFIIRKTGPGASSYWRDDQGTYGDRGLGAGLPGDVSLLVGPEYLEGELGGWLTGSAWLGLAWRHRNAVTPHPERLYAGVYLAEGRFDYVQVHGVTAEEQLQRGRDLARQGYRPVALSAASHTLTASIWHRPVIPEAAKERLAKRQANAAVALLRLGQEARVWPQLRHQPDPRGRSYLIERLSPLQADPRRLIERLDHEPDVSVRRALLLALGDFTEAQLPAAERQVYVPQLLTLYRDDPDKGMHGAAEWLLRQWQQQAKLQDIDSTLKTGKIEGGRQWYLNKEGQTFVVIPESAEPFLMGSPRGEEGRGGGPKGMVERQHRRHIGRTFALATKEVTVAEFRRFIHDRGSNIHYNETYSPTDAHPMNAVTWYEAAEYCNWLSQKEGLAEEEWCYEPHPQQGYVAGMRMKPNYLKRRGYRLPTEAEWEYACRAGAGTSRYFGETDDVVLLGRYAWYTKNSQDRAMLPVGQTRPNDWGLFDLLGNAVEWCQDSIAYYPDPYRGDSIKDLEDYKSIEDSTNRLLRGAAFADQGQLVRSAYRYKLGPANRIDDVGFRPARTCR